MSVPVQIVNSGVLNGSPPNGSLTGGQSLTGLMRTDFAATFGSSKSARPCIVGATFAGTPFVFALEGITKVRMFTIRIISGSLLLRFSSPNGGAQQVIPCSNFLQIYNPNNNDEFTVIDAEGTANVEYVLAGDIA